MREVLSKLEQKVKFFLIKDTKNSTFLYSVKHFANIISKLINGISQLKMFGRFLFTVLEARLYISNL